MQEINYDSSSDSLYKKAGNKKPDNFKSVIRWDIQQKNSTYSYTVFGNKEGKANYENKYEFPHQLIMFYYLTVVLLLKQKATDTMTY